MEQETLCQTIEELLKEIKNLKLINKILITGIKRMHDESFTHLSHFERQGYRDECQSIVMVAKMFEYKFSGMKKEDIYDKVASLTTEELFNVDSKI